MMRKYLQLGLLAAGAMLVVGSMTACSGDSTATAPIDTDPITTSTTSSSAPSSPSATPQTQSSEVSDEVEETQSPEGSPPAGTPGEDAEPDPGNGGGDGQAPDAGPDGAPLSDKARAYLAALERDNITFDGDGDNNVALTMAEYICHAQKQDTDPAMIRAFVTATGVGGTDAGQASVAADKVIRAANDHYC